jgi:hypothetical protein
MLTRALRPCALGFLLLAAAATPGAAQPSAADAVVRVPPGGRLRATVGDAKAEVAVERRPKVVEIRFGRLEQDRFVAYASNEPIAYDRPFLVQVRFSVPPTYDQTIVTLDTRGGGRHEVPVYKLATAPNVFRSRAMTFEDPGACRGLRGCGGE